MDSKTQIIEQYFKLSDLASNDERALHEIIQLFSKRAVVKGANGFIADNLSLLLLKALINLI